MRRNLLIALIAGAAGAAAGALIGVATVPMVGEAACEGRWLVGISAGLGAFAGISIGWICAATHARTGGRPTKSIAAVALGFLAGILIARQIFGSQPGGMQGLLAVASAARQRHLFFAAMAIVVVGLAFALKVQDDRVALAGLTDYPLPHLCMSRSMFGVTCPGCGLTRSFVHLAHGDWQAAWRAHRLGWLVAAIVLFQIPYRAWMLVGRRDALPPRLVQVFAVAIVALLIINWVCSLLER